MARVGATALICTPERAKTLINDLDAQECAALIDQINYLPPDLRARVIHTLMSAARAPHLTAIPLTKT